MKQKKDNWFFKDNVLYRELFFDYKGNLIKIIIDRNYNNYNANIKVVLIDLENIKEITLLKYASESLKYKNLSCYSDDLSKQYEIISKNDEDIEEIMKDILKVVQ